jgi:hypothetical protein
MSALELPSSAELASSVVPLAIACGVCGIEMKLISVDPATENTVYAYRCVNGHRHEIVVADK